MKKYKIELNETQMRVLQRVCELRFRIDLLQDYELSEILATIDMDNDDLSTENPRHNEIFNAFIDRRDHISAIVKALFEIASPYATRISHGRKRNKDSLIAEDIYQCIRYALWQDNPHKDEYPYGTVDSRSPLQVSEEPLPVVESFDKDA